MVQYSKKKLYKKLIQFLLEAMTMDLNYDRSIFRCFFHFSVMNLEDFVECVKKIEHISKKWGKMKKIVKYLNESQIHTSAVGGMTKALVDFTQHTQYLNQLQIMNIGQIVYFFKKKDMKLYPISLQSDGIFIKYLDDIVYENFFHY